MPSHRTEVLLSLLASTARAWRGTQIMRAGPAPAEPLVLYDVEGDADCRLVRELLTELDLDALIKPCPQGGRRFRRELKRGQRPPVLMDPNTGTTAVGLRPAATHLLQHYAHRTWALPLIASLPVRLSSQLASLVRLRAGQHARPSRAPRAPFELYSFESSPYSRLVRERLCELELPYVLRSFGKQQVSDYGPPHLRPTLKPYRPRAGSRREQMLKATGKVQVPYLRDPNTGEELFESEAILEYLEREYAQAAPEKEPATAKRRRR